MTVLQNVQTVCAEIGVPIPNAPFLSATDPGSLQLIALCNRAIRVISSAYPWSALRIDYTFSTVIGQAAYDMPPDFEASYNQAQWDASLRRPLIGPIDPQAWLYYVNYGVSGGVYPRFRFNGQKSLEIDPTPTTVDTIQISYRSKYGVLAADGVTRKVSFTADDDGVFKGIGPLFELELKWRFLRAKGFDYAEELQDAEDTKLQMWSIDGSKGVLNMGDPDLNRIPNTIPGNITPPP